jgi:hypothetical protein
MASRAREPSQDLERPDPEHQTPGSSIMGRRPPPVTGWAGFDDTPGYVFYIQKRTPWFLVLGMTYPPWFLVLGMTYLLVLGFGDNAPPWFLVLGMTYPPGSWFWR